MPSITLQVICDTNKIFVDIFTGLPNKIHDARIFQLSHISKNVKNICSEEFHLLGDAAYPLRKWLLTPYRDYGNLTDSERNFNYKLSATRVKIENAFGLLKQRFRQLQRTEFLSVIKISQFIVSCCVLHNFCLMNDDDWIENIEIEHNTNIANNEATSIAIEKIEGEAKRNRLRISLE